MSPAVGDDRLGVLPGPPGVRVWTLHLDARPDDARRAHLSLDDLRRVRSLRGAAGPRLLARRALLRTAVAGLASCAPDDVDPLPGPGPRRVRLPDARTWYVSASSSGDLGLLVVAEVPVGVDVERLPAPPDALLVSRQLLAPREHAWIAAGGADAGRRFLATWVRKEAVVKSTGEGMSRDLRSFTVDARRPTAPVVGPDGRSLGLVTHDVAVPGHLAAVAVAVDDGP